MVLPFLFARCFNMTSAYSAIMIHASAGAIWQVVSDFGGACTYLAGVVACTVEGEGIGARRTLTDADGTRSSSGWNAGHSRRAG